VFLAEAASGERSPVLGTSIDFRVDNGGRRDAASQHRFTVAGAQALRLKPVLNV
jgi:hypothetical protein